MAFPLHPPVRVSSVWATLLGLCLVLGALALATGLGLLGEATWWAAALLHLEPLVWVLAGLAAYLLVWRGRWGLAGAVSLAVGGAAIVLRLPLPTLPEAIVAPPEWGSRVSRCAQAVGAPTDDSTVLVWSIDGPVPSERLVSAVVGLHPDVVVLPRLRDGGVVEAVRAELGGEAMFLHGGGGAVGLYTLGEFPLCGEETQWMTARSAAAGIVVVFVAPRPGVTFPLVLGRLPDPGTATDWDEEYLGTTASLAAVARALASPGAVVVVDGASTTTYRRVEASLAAVDLRGVAAPPNWPSRVLGLPFLPLQPFDRAWVGAGWSAGARRLRSGLGSRDPVLLTLRPRRSVGLQPPDPAHQRPTSPS